jgi:hypothetical protein
METLTLTGTTNEEPPLQPAQDLDGIVPGTSFDVVSEGTFRATGIFTTATIPKRLTILAPRPPILVPCRVADILLQVVVPTPGMVMHSGLRTRAEGWTACVGEVVTFVAPFPPTLSGSILVGCQEVMAAPSVDMGTTGGAARISVKC